MYPPAQNQYLQDKILSEVIFGRIHAGPVFALARYRKTVLRNHVPHLIQVLEEIHVGANTCRARVLPHAVTGKYSWRIICVLVSCQGVISPLSRVLRDYQL